MPNGNGCVTTISFSYFALFDFSFIFYYFLVFGGTLWRCHKKCFNKMKLVSKRCNFNWFYPCPVRDRAVN